MARVELNIVALGDFSSINTQIKSLQVQIDLLNKSVAGVGLGTNLTKDLNSAAAAFKNTMLSTGAFTHSTVQLTTETTKFGKALVEGKLALSQYYNIVTGKSGATTNSVKALALEQTKLQNSVIMADPTKKGFYSVFTPSTINKVTDATKIAANEQNIYNLAVQNGSKALINWGKNTQWAGRQLTVGLTVPVMLFGSQATQVFKDVNEQIVRLQKVYGTGLTQPSKQALEAIKNQTLGLAKELASSMGISVKDTASMAADLAATGKTGNDLIVATREAMRLSKLGEMDTQQAMQTTISLQNVYKLNTTQLSEAINFLNAVENQTSTSLQDLAAGIPKVGPIVQQLGGSFKDTAVMMVAMKEAGVPAAQSANAIKSALASLINPTKAAKDAFAAYNINVGAIATKEKGNPIKMIMDLQAALKGLAPLAQSQLIEKLFGKFQEARIQALITNLGAANSQTKTAFDLMNANSSQLASVAAGEMKTATESTTGKYQRSLETFKADLIPVGQKILEITTTLMNFGNTVAKIFGGLPGPIKSLLGIAVIGTVLAGPIIMLTGLMANFLGYIVKTVFNLKQLATGGRTLGQLLTPELIASQNAAELFSKGILGDVGAVDLLNQAIKNLTISMEGLVSSMNAGTGIAGIESVIAAEAGLAGGKIPFKAPGFSEGGIVPGTGNTDSVPAMLMPGEMVLTKEQTKNLNRTHFMPNEAGGMMWMKALDNQRMRQDNPETGWKNPLPPISSGEVATGLEELLKKNVHPMALSYGAALKLGAKNTKETAIKLDNALGALIAELKKEKIIFGGAGQSFEAFSSKIMAPHLSGISTQNGTSNLYSDFKQFKTIRGQGGSEGSKSIGVSWGDIPEQYQGPKNSTLARLMGTGGGVNKEVALNKNSAAIREAVLANEINIASQSKSPSQATAKAAQNMVDGVTETLTQSASKIKTVTEESVVGSEYSKGGFLSGVKNKLTNQSGGMNVMARMGASSALMMGGQMATSMLPQGGAAASVVGGMASMGGMGMMFGPQGMAIGAAIGGLSAVMKILSNDMRVQSNSLKSSFQISSVAAEQFGIKITPLAQYDFASTKSGLDQHIKSIQDNKAAVDQLTQAYINSKDQMVQDRLKSLHGMGSKELAFEMSKTFASNMAVTGDSNKATQDVMSQLAAAKIDPTKMAYVKSQLPQYKNSVEALQAQLGYADKTFMPGFGPVGSMVPKKDARQVGSDYGPGYVAPNFRPRAVQVRDETASNIATILQNLTLTGTKQLDNITKSLGTAKSAAIDTDQVYKAFSQNIDKSSPGFGKIAAKFRSAGGSSIDLAKAVTLMNSQLVTTKEVQDALVSGKGDLTALWDKYKDAIIKGQDVASGSTGGLGGTGTTFTESATQKGYKKLLEARVKDENVVLKGLNQQLKSYKDQATEAKRILDYENQRFSLMQDQKTALMSGNFLGAAEFKQSSTALGIDFNTTTKENAFQNTIDKIQLRADDFATALADLNDVIAQQKHDIPKSVVAASKELRMAAVNGGTQAITIQNNITLGSSDSSSQVESKVKSVTSGSLAAAKAQTNGKPVAVNNPPKYQLPGGK